MIRKENDDLELPSECPDEETVRALVKRSSVWASTAIGFIQDGHNRLKILLRREARAKAESALDDLYITPLQSADKKPSPSSQLITYQGSNGRSPYSLSSSLCPSLE
jgi:hypothetical protein